jgi:hypothetical protein
MSRVSCRLLCPALRMSHTPDRGYSTAATMDHLWLFSAEEKTNYVRPTVWLQKTDAPHLGLWLEYRYLYKDTPIRKAKLQLAIPVRGRGGL